MQPFAIHHLGQVGRQLQRCSLQAGIGLIGYALVGLVVVLCIVIEFKVYVGQHRWRGLPDTFLVKGEVKILIPRILHNPKCQTIFPFHEHLGRNRDRACFVIAPIFEMGHKLPVQVNPQVIVVVGIESVYGIRVNDGHIE